MSEQHRTDDMIHVRLPAELRAAIDRDAKQQERTVSQQVRYLLLKAVAPTHQQQHGEAA